MNHTMSKDCPCGPSVEQVPASEDRPMVVHVGGVPADFTLSFHARCSPVQERQYFTLSLADIRALRSEIDEALDDYAERAGKANG